MNRQEFAGFPSRSRFQCAIVGILGAMPIDAAAEEQFGPYLVYERLGVGGMATVHRALEQGA